MKKLLLIFVVSFIMLNTFAQSGQVKVTVTGIKIKKSGILKVGLYKQDGFPIIGKEITGKKMDINSEKVTITLDSISDGTYAIAVIQDINKDGKLSTNLFGVPTEPYAFSYNKYGMFGPPDFEDVSFEIKGGKTVSLTINLN